MASDSTNRWKILTFLRFSHFCSIPLLPVVKHSDRHGMFDAALTATMYHSCTVEPDGLFAVLLSYPNLSKPRTTATLAPKRHTWRNPSTSVRKHPLCWSCRILSGGARVSLVHGLDVHSFITFRVSFVMYPLVIYMFLTHYVVSESHFYRVMVHRRKTCFFAKSQLQGHKPVGGCSHYTNLSSREVAAANVFIGCTQCSAGSVIWRCCFCYHMFATAIRSHTATNSKEKRCSVEMIEALLAIDWLGVDGSARSVDGAMSCLTYTSRRCWVWKRRCPSCFDIALPSPPEVGVLSSGCVPSSFADTVPPVPDYEKVLIRRALMVDPQSGERCFRDVVLHVHTVHPVITRKDSMKFRFRFGDEPQHQNYRLIGQYGKVEADEISEWVVVRSAVVGGNGGEVISMRHLGCLLPLSGNVGHARRHHKGRTFLHATRRLASKRDESLKVAPRIKKLLRFGVECSQLRVSRVSGPNGHAGGQRMSVVRREVCSPLVCGAIPRNHRSTIVVPVLRGGAVYGAVPFYISAEASHPKVVSNPKYGVPRNGWKVSGSRLFGVHLEDKNKTIRDYNRVMCATEYNGALLLLQLAKRRSTLTTSWDAASSTWNDYGVLKGLFDARRDASLLGTLMECENDLKEEQCSVVSHMSEEESKEEESGVAVIRREAATESCTFSDVCTGESVDYCLD